jgi:hypothetical protein
MSFINGEIMKRLIYTSLLLMGVAQFSEAGNYGSFYNDVPQVLTPGVPEQVSFTQDNVEENGVTNDGSGLFTISTTGDYLINWNIDLQSMGVFEVDVALIDTSTLPNPVPFTPSPVRTVVEAGLDSLSGSWAVTIPGGDQIQLVVTQPSIGPTLTINDASISIIQISQSSAHTEKWEIWD